MERLRSALLDHCPPLITPPPSRFLVFVYSINQSILQGWKEHKIVSMTSIINKEKENDSSGLKKSGDEPAKKEKG